MRYQVPLPPPPPPPISKLFSRRSSTPPWKKCRRVALVVILVWWLAWVMYVLYRPLYYMSEPSVKTEPLQLVGTQCEMYPKCDRVTHLPTGYDQCDFNVMNDTRYLPDPVFLSCVRSMRTRWMTDLQRYTQQIRFLQSPAKCDRPESSLGDKKWHVVKFTSHGHGVNTFYMAVNVGNHWDRGIPVLASLSAYRFGSHQEICQGKDRVHRGWSCHMSPLSTFCDLSNVPLSSVVNLNRMRRAHVGTEWCVPHGKYEPLFGRCRCDVGYLPSEEGSHCLPFDSDPTFSEKRKWQKRYEIYHSPKPTHQEDDDYAMTGTEHWISRLSPGEVFPAENLHDPAHVSSRSFARDFPAKRQYKFKLKYGFFWWMLQNIWILHKDAPKRREMEAKVLSFLGTDAQCVAVHVRRGDSCDDATARHRTCPKLETYLNHVSDMKQRYYNGRGPFKVYLATDDPSTIDEARRIMSSSEGTWDIVWQNINRGRYVNGKAVDNNPSLFTDEAMDELYFDLWAISFCHLGFVASFASSVAWNGYALATGRFGYYIPFVSVDLPWGHRILGAHHAKHNVFDTTLEEQDLAERQSLFV